MTKWLSLSDSDADVKRGFAKEDGKIVVRHTQDVEPILRENAILREMTDGYSPSKDLLHIASIPEIVLEKWYREEGLCLLDRNHWPAIMKKLRSSEYAYLRTSNKRI
jgi:hypothetical protein